MINLNESQGLNLYKKLLNNFSDFVDKQPGTGMGRIYRKLLDAGIKCMPSDKRALEILSFVLSSNVSKSIQDLINTSFVDLPMDVRPVYKVGNSRFVAFWNKDSKIFSKTMDLIDYDGVKGSWSDEKGDAVTLITPKEE